jgi:serine/threonine protein kinase
MIKWQVGEIINDRYEIKELRSGGMGEVYILYDRYLSRSLAAKTLKSNYLSNRNMRELFYKEMNITTSIKSNFHLVIPYFIKVIDGRPFIFMEYIEGSNLKTLIGQLNFSFSLHLSIQLCAGMLYLHEFLGIVHRDLKPENILINKNGIVKITDFGLGGFHYSTILWGDREGQDSEVESQYIRGTKPYMSPEQWNGQHIGKWSDIYSFGIVIYELLTRNLPFHGQNDAEWRLLHTKTIPKTPSKINPIIPMELDQLISKCLEKDFRCRPSHFSDIMKELESIYLKEIGKKFSYDDLHEYMKEINLF